MQKLFFCLLSLVFSAFLCQLQLCVDLSMKITSETFGLILMNFILKVFILIFVLCRIISQDGFFSIQTAPWAAIPEMLDLNLGALPRRLYQWATPYPSLYPNNILVPPPPCRNVRNVINILDCYYWGPSTHKLSK